MECPASAKRGGASARIRRAIAPILSSRMWLATVTGPNRHSAGATGAKIRGEETRPGTSRIGIVSSIAGSGKDGFGGKTGLERADVSFETSLRSILLFEHDLFSKTGLHFSG